MGDRTAVADRHIADLERQLQAADKRIAELESRLRQGETLSLARHRDHGGLLEAARRQCAMLVKRNAELAEELRTSDQIRSGIASAARDTAYDISAVLERLELYQPVIDAARDLCDAYDRDDDHAGTAACIEIKAAVQKLPPVPS